MIPSAQRNAKEYGPADRVEGVKGDAPKMPFEDDYFDAVFSNGSLYEWVHPEDILNEIARVLEPGGRYCISDFRRDMDPLIKWFLRLMTQPKSMRSGAITSINDSYTLPEMTSMPPKMGLQSWHARMRQYDHSRPHIIRDYHSPGHEAELVPALARQVLQLVGERED